MAVEKPNSFRKMADEKIIVRADGEKIDYFQIFPEPGFNPVGRTEEDDEDDEELYQFIVKNGVLALPQWEVRPRAEGGVWIVDCHRRHKQTGRAIREGQFKPDPKTGKYLIPIKQFVGNDLQRLYRIGTSNKSKKMKAVQFAEICQRAVSGFGQTVEQIAEGMQCSISTVKNALVLASSNHDVQQMVKDGSVSASTAIQLQREKGEEAGPILKEELAKAEEKGKGKVMPASLKARSGATQRDIKVGEAVRSALLDICRESVNGVHYDAMLDLDLSELIAKEVK